MSPLVYSVILKSDKIKEWHVCNNRKFNVVFEFCEVTSNCSRYVSLPTVNTHGMTVLHYLEQLNVFKNVFYCFSDSLRNELFNYSVFITDVLKFIIHSTSNSNKNKWNIKLFSWWKEIGKRAETSVRKTSRIKSNERCHIAIISRQFQVVWDRNCVRIFMQILNRWKRRRNWRKNRKSIYFSFGASSHMLKFGRFTS